MYPKKGPAAKGPEIPLGYFPGCLPWDPGPALAACRPRDGPREAAEKPPATCL